MKFNMMKRENLKEIEQKVKYNKDHEDWNTTLNQIIVEFSKRV